MNSIFRGILDGLKLAYVGSSVRMLKIRGAIYYLEGVKSTYRALIQVCLVAFLITLVGAGLVLIPLALFIFMPWEPATKAVVGIVIGSVYMIVAGVGLISLLSEKRWMRLTGASEILHKLLG